MLTEQYIQASSKIKGLMKSNNITQKMLSGALGTHQATISMALSPNYTKQFTPKQIEKIANYFSVSVDSLIDDAATTNKDTPVDKDKANGNILFPNVNLKNCDVYIIAEQISVSFIDNILREASTCVLVTSSTRATVIADFLCKKSGWRKKGFKLFYDDRPLPCRPSVYITDQLTKGFWGCDTAFSYETLLEYVEKLSPVKDGDIDSIAIVNNAIATYIPLFQIDRETRTKVAPNESGVNWGCRDANIANEGPVKAYIPITTSSITTDAFFIPGDKGREHYTDVIWDDGTIMPACFGGKGRTVNGLRYPRWLTSRDGGAIMGKYIRKRLGVNEQEKVTYKHFSLYGKDYVWLIKLAEDVYYVDFSLCDGRDKLRMYKR